MGKHEDGYKDVRPDNDLFPTPAWVTNALCEHIDITGKTVWECACGTGMMTEALKANGAEVLSSDIVDHGYAELDGTFDFVYGKEPSEIPPFDGIITNPAYGYHNTLIKKWIEYGLKRLPPGGFLCLLLPNDYDSGKTRHRWFRTHPWFIAKVVVTKRIMWFKPELKPGEKKKGPKENHSWFVWQRPSANGHAPSILKPAQFAAQIRYAPINATIPMDNNLVPAAMQVRALEEVS